MLPKNLYLFLVATIANLLSVSCGISIFWVTPILPKLDGTRNLQESPFDSPLTSSEISWLVGLLALGATFGPLIAGKIADQIGRKRTLLIIAGLNIVSLLITAFARDITLFFIARFLAGIALGTTYTVLPMYLAEISEVHNRGILGCSFSIFVAVGTMLPLLFGLYFDIQMYNLACLVPLLLFIPLFAVFSPETPIFLASQNDEKKLTFSLLKLRNKTFDEISLEVASIVEIVQQNSNNGKVFDLFRRRSLCKGLVISVGCVFLAQSAGIGAILSYMQVIFEKANVDLAPEYCVIIVSLFQLFGTILSISAVERLGRRFLLLSSSFFACLSLVGLGIYFYLDSNGFDLELLSWLPITTLVIYTVTFNVGLGPVPWVVMAELFPSNFVAVAATITVCACFLTAFVVAVTFPSLSIALGMAGCFLIFSVVCLVGSVFIYFVMPETKGKSIQEIQKLLE